MELEYKLTIGEHLPFALKMGEYVFTTFGYGFRIHEKDRWEVSLFFTVPNDFSHQDALSFGGLLGYYEATHKFIK